MAAVPGKGQTHTSDGGGTSKKNQNTGSLYGSNYGGAAAGNTGSNLGLYGSNYGGAAAGSYKPTATSSSTKTSIGDRAVTGNTYTRGTIPASYGKYNLPSSDPKGGGGGGTGSYSASSSSSGGGGNVASYTPNDNYLQKYLDLLNQAYQGYRSAQDEMLKQRLAQADFDAMESRERNNMNAKLAERRVNNIYGAQNNGARSASASRVWANWLNGGSNIERDRLNNRQTHQINYSNALANNDLNYANTMYNLRSSDLNRQADLEYRKYLATLG